MSLYIRSDSGLWVYVENLDLGRYFWACYFGMVSGGLLFLISFLGCMGTTLDSRLLFSIVSTMCLCNHNNINPRLTLSISTPSCPWWPS